MPQICKILLKDYCANCTFAGLRYIADDTKHWIERLLWVVLVVLSWCGSAVLVIAAWDSFVFHPISFGVETTYLEWNTEMPAVAICEAENQINAFKYIDKNWPPDHNLDIEDALREVLFFRGTCNSLAINCYVEGTPDPICPLSNYSQYISLLRRKCPEIITNCSYNDKPFNCCEYLLPIDTDIGQCFILNSIQVKNPNPYVKMANMTHKRAVLKFRTVVQSLLYVIGHEDIPTLTSYSSYKQKIQPGYNYSRHIVVKMVENDPLVVHTTIEQRACRFSTENEDGLYPYYSYSGCIVQCRKRAQMELCHCNDHLMPFTSELEHCNISGLVCLNTHKDHLTVLKPPWGKGVGLVCDCQPNCDQKEISTIRNVQRSQKKQKFSEVELALAYLPTERFKRNVVRSRLDLVVSVGGAAGLFVGASILSFVELIFYFTVRLGSNVMMNRRQEKPKRVVQKAKNVDVILLEDIGVNADQQQTAYLNTGVDSSIPIYSNTQKSTSTYINKYQVNKQTKLQVFRTRRF